MRAERKKKNKEDSVPEKDTVAFVPVAASSGAFCTADQCSFTPPAQAAPMTSQSASVNPFFTGSVSQKEAIHSQSFTNSSSIPERDLRESSLAELLPGELYDLIKTAALTGALVSFLLTLTEEGLTTYLKTKGYTARQIYGANQGIRALMLLGVGTSIETVLAIPFANYLMTDYLNFKPTTANAISSGLSIAIGIYNNPLSLIEASATITTAIASSLVSSTLTRSAYSYIRNSRFFSSAPAEMTDSESHSAVFTPK